MRAANALIVVWFLLVAGNQPASNGLQDHSPRRPSRRIALERQWDHEWLEGAVVYEVFVRSFADSDGDGIGDLPGLISRLDYLNDGDPATTSDIGVRALWLMPVFDSPSYHGYDIIDYETINPDYGTLADFSELASECDRRGIRLVLDLVLNHSGRDHPWFVDSSTGESSPYRDWYVWNPTDPGWTQPWGGSYPTWHLNVIDGSYYYGVFWGGMPDLNYRTPAVRAEAIRLAELWLDRGADGFRLDASRYLIETGGGRGQADTNETHAFWREFTRAVRRVRPETLIVAENWADTATIATYFGSTAVITAGDELPLNFNFPLADRTLDAVRTASRIPIEEVLAAMANSYPEGVRDAPFLTNHDQVRVATQLADDGGRLRAAASVLLTVPGAPFIYYGEEVGLRNGSGSGDEAKRTPMPWADGPGGGFTTGSPWYAFAPGRDTANVADQTDDPGSLLSHYRGLIGIRGSSPALGAGTVRVPTHSNDEVLVLERIHPDETVLVLVNLSGAYRSATGIQVDARPDEELFTDGNAGDLTGSPGNLSIVLPPYATAVWRVTPTKRGSSLR